MFDFPSLFISLELHRVFPLTTNSKTCRVSDRNFAFYYCHLREQEWKRKSHHGLLYNKSFIQCWFLIEFLSMSFSRFYLHSMYPLGIESLDRNKRKRFYFPLFDSSSFSCCVKRSNTMYDDIRRNDTFRSFFLPFCRIVYWMKTKTTRAVFFFLRIFFAAYITVSLPHTRRGVELEMRGVSFSWSMCVIK